MKNTKKKGFTIVELVIVIAVIGILSAILIPTFANLVSKAQETALQANLRNAYTEYAGYAAADPDFHSQEEVAFVVNENGEEKIYVFDNGTYYEVEGGTSYTSQDNTKTYTVGTALTYDPDGVDGDEAAIESFNGYNAKTVTIAPKAE